MANTSILVYETTAAEKEPDYQLMQDVYNFLYKYVLVIVAIVGIPGNFVTMLVNLRAHNRKLSVCVYMTATAIADNVVLVAAVSYLVCVTWGFGSAIQGSFREVFFQLEWYLAFCPAMLSGLFLAEMSVDRLIAVAFPMAATRLCTNKRAYITVGVTTAIIAPLNINIFYTYQHYEDKDTGLETLITDFENQDIEMLVSAFQLFFGTACPFAVIIMSNIVIIFKLKKASEERSEMQGGAGNTEKTNYLTRMLLFVSFAYVVTSIPYRLYFFIMDTPVLTKMYVMTERYWSLRYNLQYVFFLTLWYCNFAINFPLYCIGGGHRFRNDTKYILRYCDVRRVKH
ncbi:uncharacterized protein LOC135497750 isoform X2 [Lineus longissimus]|uniref:uncharacterized protein LOC135497750 isoform X2 n=1 Tax=Lineus longissimus TaxID=88925 RepID=UPI00315D0A52